MDKLQDSLRSFETFLANISDEKLDAMLAKIDAMGIQGPSADEYMESLNRGVASFYDEPSETCTMEEVDILFNDTHIKDTSTFGMPAASFLCAGTTLSVPLEEYSASENIYAMAA